MKMGSDSIMRSDQQSQVVVDSEGRIFLANNRMHSLALYGPRRTTPTASLIIGTIADMALDKEDNLYVIEWPMTPGSDGYADTVFKAGTLTPMRRLKFSRDSVPFAMTIVE